MSIVVSRHGVNLADTAKFSLDVAPFPTALLFLATPMLITLIHRSGMVSCPLGAVHLFGSAVSADVQVKSQVLERHMC